jgi:hypothetical protein
MAAADWIYVSAVSHALKLVKALGFNRFYEFTAAGFHYAACL